MKTATATTTATLPDVKEETYTGHPVKLSKRPKRDTVIGKDDILNLRIALATSKTWEEFISRV